MRFSVPGLAAATLLAAAAPALGDVKNCRQCTTTVKVTGRCNSAYELNTIMHEWAKKYTGGDFLGWTPEPTAANGWSGSAHFERLCGKSKTVSATWTSKVFDNQDTTVVIDSKDCKKNVRCHDGSKCHESGIL